MHEYIPKKSTRAQAQPVALVVDDEESYLKILRDALTEAGCRVACCTTPPKAREVALEVGPDIFLIDQVMPEMDGVELCRHFRADPRFKTAVIVLMTSETDPTRNRDAIVRGLEAGADDYLIKPSGIREVPIRLPAWWRAKRWRDELIADAQQAVEALHHEQAYNAAVLSSMADALLVVSSQGAIVDCNQRALDMLGYGRDELIGSSLDRVSASSPGLPGGGLRDLGKSLLHGRIRDVDALLRHRDGRVVPVSLSCSPLSMPGGEASGLILVARDISIRQRLQEEQRNYAQHLEQEVGRRTEGIRKSAEEYRILFKNVDHAIVTTGLDNKLLTCNAAAERLFGWKEAEVLGRTAGEALCGKSPHAKYADIQAKVAELGFWTHEGTGCRADGQNFPMHLSVSVVRQESGLPQGMIWIITDLSDRYGLEEAAQRARDYAEVVLATFGPHGVLVGSGPAHKRIVKFVSDAAAVPSPVLVLGESGTGKEVVARAIHANSPRANEPFVVVDCSTLQGSLLENELFGHEKGAFTGATEAKMGLVELAAGGTLFVDEIGDMPLDLQAKLLRILDCGEFRRVGSLKERKVDMRIVAATNRDLAKEARSGRFRKDLYFRLNVLSITMPPLRERREDIPLLAKHFAKHNRVTMATKKRFRADTLQCLQAYDWPGNIRELANVVERAVILAGPQTALQPSHLPPEARAATRHPEGEPPARSLAQAEKEAIEAALAATKGNRSKAAQMLGTSRMTLRKMMNQHGISVLKP